MEGLKEIAKNLNFDSRYAGLDSNLAPLKQFRALPLDQPVWLNSLSVRRSHIS